MYVIVVFYQKYKSVFERIYFLWRKMKNGYNGQLNFKV